MDGKKFESVLHAGVQARGGAHCQGWAEPGGGVEDSRQQAKALLVVTTVLLC